MGEFKNRDLWWAEKTKGNSPCADAPIDVHKSILLPIQAKNRPATFYLVKYLYHPWNPYLPAVRMTGEQ